MVGWYPQWITLYPLWAAALLVLEHHRKECAARTDLAH